MAKNQTIAEYGDFQTPAVLAQHVCALLSKRGVQPASLLEPTCGLGSLLFAGLDQFAIQKAVGADINPTYVKWAQTTLSQRRDADKVTLTESNFFATDWQAVIGDLPQPILLLGNPPWVTNAHLATLGSQNLPAKTNFQKHNGFDAMTGKANFDISESMLIRLIDTMNGRQGTLAMLCKSSVARKALCHAWKNDIAVENAAIHAIDANLHFDASVDAVLLVIDFRPGAYERGATVYASLKAVAPQTVIGYEDGALLADVKSHHRWKHLCGGGTLQWRSGIKHDCSKVMELRRQGGRYRNGFGALVELEDTFLYPMLKSSGVANGGKDHRWLIVTQHSIGDGTETIEGIAPKTWAYLTAHADLLNNRGSSIYRQRPPFSIFGVGDYSFAPWKVAISGFYKRLAFATIAPMDGKPVMLDDTSYFLPCASQQQADYLAFLLNSPAAQSFYSAFVFWDAKRPITVDLLRRLDISALARELGTEPQFAAYFGTTAMPKKGRRRAADRATITLWSD